MIRLKTYPFGLYVVLKMGDVLLVQNLYLLDQVAVSNVDDSSHVGVREVAYAPYLYLRLIFII